jgi:hypothetical protein
VDWQKHIGADQAVLTGKPVIQGTRLAVEFILGLIAQGWPEQEITLKLSNQHRTGARVRCLRSGTLLQLKRGSILAVPDNSRARISSCSIATPSGKLNKSTAAASDASVFFEHKSKLVFFTTGRKNSWIENWSGPSVSSCCGIPCVWRDFLVSLLEKDEKTESIDSAFATGPLTPVSVPLKIFP